MNRRHGPMTDASERIDSFDTSLGYRIRKRAGEQAVERTFDDRGTVLRCTSIAGFNYSGNATQQVAPYWASRLTAAPDLSCANSKPVQSFRTARIR